MSDPRETRAQSARSASLGSMRPRTNITAILQQLWQTLFIESYTLILIRLISPGSSGMMQCNYHIGNTKRGEGLHRVRLLLLVVKHSSCSAVVDIP